MRKRREIERNWELVYSKLNLKNVFLLLKLKINFKRKSIDYCRQFLLVYSCHSSLFVGNSNNFNPIYKLYSLLPSIHSRAYLHKPILFIAKIHWIDLRNDSTRLDSCFPHFASTKRLASFFLNTHMHTCTCVCCGDVGKPLKPQKTQSVSKTETETEKQKPKTKTNFGLQLQQERERERDRAPSSGHINVV